MAWYAGIEHSFREGTVTLYVSVDGAAAGTRGIAQPIVLKDIPEGHMAHPDIAEGFLPNITPETLKGFLQTMMDLAYEEGLRPSRAQDERHQKAHLEDMRKIAFHGLGISGS